MCNDDHEAEWPADAFLPGRGVPVGGQGPGAGVRSPQPQPPGPQSAGEAVGLMLAGLGWLAGADLASVPVAVQADCLRALERAGSLHTAAHANALSAFDAAAGYEHDGQGSPRTWLRWQTQVTGASASTSVTWMRRLRAHAVVAAALRDARITASWAKEICAWTDRLPDDTRDDADQILLAAAAGGAELSDLARLADEMRRRLAQPDDGNDHGFEDRQLRLQATLDGAGRLDGDLTARCAASLQAVMDALGKKAGPEDTRTQRQRYHDALEEALRRLIASGCLPDRAGQPTQIQLYMSLDELARQNENLTSDGRPTGDCQPGPQASSTAAARQGPGGTGSFWPAAAPGDLCDATIIPIVTGRVDQDLLDKLTATLRRRCAIPSRPGEQCAPGDPGAQGDDLSDEIRDLLLASAVALLSGPGQLASLLRTGTLAGPAATISLPLDLGAAADSIPPHLRRAVILRDKHCMAPGCFQPAVACQVHHATRRSKGGRTKLTGLILLCPFHHLVVVHRWCFTITLNPDGTTTMRSPDGSRVYRSHSPPPATAA